MIVCGASRLDRAARALAALCVLLLFAARCGAAPSTAMVAEVAGYGDYALQSGFFETFRDILEESLLRAGKLRLVMRRPASEDAEAFSLIHMDAIARGHHYRREMAGAALIRYADAAYGRQNEEKAKAWRKEQRAPYTLGANAAEAARRLGQSYGSEYLLFCNLGGMDVERVRSLWNAEVSSFEMRAKEIHAEISYYVVHAPTGRVYEGHDAMDKRGQLIGIVVGQYGKGFTVEQLLLSVLDRQAKRAAEGIVKDGLPRVGDKETEEDGTETVAPRKELFAVPPFTSRVRITNLAGEETAAHGIAGDYLLDELAQRGLSFVDGAAGTRAARKTEAAAGGRPLADVQPRWLLAGALTDLGVSESKRPGSTALVVRVGLSVRVLDAATGGQVFVATGVGESAAKQYEAGLFGVHLLRFGTREFSEECLFEAMQKAVREIAEKIGNRYGETTA
ncbi:MAG: hypothetical protein IJ812_03150 [Schwartzia sp.]|nr:hypothetical protein [Schwartzia sp. (in: firmicutes)]MBR1885384.1 hypothetical protein [Schwartzia sp. (in: firmicutes)]